MQVKNNNRIKKTQLAVNEPTKFYTLDYPLIKKVVIQPYCSRSTYLLASVYGIFCLPCSKSLFALLAIPHESSNQRCPHDDIQFEQDSEPPRIPP